MKMNIKNLKKGDQRIHMYLTIQEIKKLDEVCGEIEKVQSIKMNRSKLVRWLINEYLQDPYILLLQQKKEKIKEINQIQTRILKIEEKRQMSEEETEKIKIRMLGQ